MRFFFFFFFFRAAPKPCGSSQVRGQISPTAAGLHHSYSNTGCKLHHSWRQHQILNPLSEARDRTCILNDTSQVPYLWATMRTPLGIFKIITLLKNNSHIIQFTHLNSTTQYFLVFSQTCTTMTSQFYNIFITLKRNPVQLNYHLHFINPPSSPKLPLIHFCLYRFAN